MVVGALLWALLMGYTWTGTQTRIYDDSDATGGHASGQPHSAAEMAASSDANVAANWVALAGNSPKYRGLATTLFGSSTGGTATTTWTDTDATFDWDNTKTIQIVGANGFLNWGTKVGSGAIATGRNGVHAYFGATTTLSQRNMIYGGSLTVLGTNNSLSLQGDASSEYMDCIVGVKGTSAVLANIRVGQSGVATGTLYNVDFWGNASGGTSSIISIFNPTLCQRITVGGNAMGAELRLTNSSSFALKDAIFFGSPSSADLVLVSSFGTGVLVKPVWSGGTKVSSSLTIPAGNLREAWLFDVEVVDSVGNPVSGASVKLTDALGNVQVNTSSDSNGRVSFGSGIEANAVTVIDHVVTAGAYSTRTRSPFRLDVNDVHMNLKWIGEATQTYEDMRIAVALQAATGNPTTWVEMTL